MISIVVQKRPKACLPLFLVISRLFKGVNLTSFVETSCLGLSFQPFCQLALLTTRKVEYKTNLYLTSILLRLPEKQQQMAHSPVNFDGYKFFTGTSNECKFQLGDKNYLPGNETELARDMAGMNEISSCVADNSDTAGDMKPRRSTAHLKFHPHPFEHNEQLGLKAKRG